MTPDEYGTYTLLGSSLTITAIGEKDSTGKNVLYKNSTDVRLQISKNGNDLVLTIISWGSRKSDEFPTLRLTKK